jgi:hypothetical protein
MDPPEFSYDRQRATAIRHGQAAPSPICDAVTVPQRSLSPHPVYPQAMSSAMKSRGWLRLSMIVLAWVACVSIADALERPGDADNMEDLRRRATAATAIHRDFLALIEAAPRKEKFELYRTYDESIGTWVQIGFLRETLDASIAASSWTMELKLRTDLRDQARYALWEVDQSIAYLAVRIAKEKRARPLRLVKAMRSALLNVRATVTRLAAAP